MELDPNSGLVNDVAPKWSQWHPHQVRVFETVDGFVHVQPELQPDSSQPIGIRFSNVYLVHNALYEFAMDGELDAPLVVHFSVQTADADQMIWEVPGAVTSSSSSPSQTSTKAAFYTRFTTPDNGGCDLLSDFVLLFEPSSLMWEHPSSAASSFASSELRILRRSLQLHCTHRQIACVRRGVTCDLSPLLQHERPVFVEAIVLNRDIEPHRWWECQLRFAQVGIPVRRWSSSDDNWAESLICLLKSITLADSPVVVLTDPGYAPGDSWSKGEEELLHSTKIIKDKYLTFLSDDYGSFAVHPEFCGEFISKLVTHQQRIPLKSLLQQWCLEYPSRCWTCPVLVAAAAGSIPTVTSDPFRLQRIDTMTPVTPEWISVMCICSCVGSDNKSTTANNNNNNNNNNKDVQSLDARLLNSLLHQTYPYWQLILLTNDVAGCKSGLTLPLDSRVQIVEPPFQLGTKKKNNNGQPRGWLLGAAATRHHRGRFRLFVQRSDELHPDCLASHLAPLLYDPSRMLMTVGRAVSKEDNKAVLPIDLDLSCRVLFPNDACDAIAEKDEEGDSEEFDMDACLRSKLWRYGRQMSNLRMATYVEQHERIPSIYCRLPSPTYWSSPANQPQTQLAIDARQKRFEQYLQAWNKRHIESL